MPSAVMDAASTSEVGAGSIRAPEPWLVRLSLRLVGSSTTPEPTTVATFEATSIPRLSAMSPPVMSRSTTTSSPGVWAAMA